MFLATRPEEWGLTGPCGQPVTTPVAMALALRRIAGDAARAIERAGGRSVAVNVTGWRGISSEVWKPEAFMDIVEGNARGFGWVIDWEEADGLGGRAMACEWDRAGPVQSLDALVAKTLGAMRRREVA